MKRFRGSIVGSLAAATFAIAGTLAVAAPAQAAHWGQGIECDTWDEGSTAYGSCTGVNPNDTMIPWDLKADCVYHSFTGRLTHRYVSRPGVSDGRVISVDCPYSYELWGYHAEMD